jgi:MFS family permease
MIHFPAVAGPRRAATLHVKTPRVPSYVVVWALLVCAWVSNYLVRMALPPLLGPIMAELALSYRGAGWLASAFFYAYMAMQVAGMLGDRIGRKRVAIGGLIVCAGASVATGFAGTFTALVLARLLTGLGQGCLFSNDRVIIAGSTPPARVALGQGVSFSGPGLGLTLGIVLAGALGEVLPAGSRTRPAPSRPGATWPPASRWRAGSSRSWYAAPGPARRPPETPRV